MDVSRTREPSLIAYSVCCLRGFMVVKCMEISYVWDAMTMNTENPRDA
jgi:hypothetical protein